MWQPQFMSRCSHDMTVTRLCFYLCVAQLIIISLLPSDVHCSTYSRFRSKTNNAKKSIEDATEASNAVPDQIALAANNNNQRRKDSGYKNLELNLVRPEKESRLRAHISTKYSTSIISDHTPSSSLEDAETAEEYVSKAMQRYGARLTEPIRIESEPEIVNTGNTNEGAGSYYERPTSTEHPQKQQPQQEYVSGHSRQEEDQSEYDTQEQAQLQIQQRQQHQQEQQQQAQFDYYQSQQGHEAIALEQQNTAELLVSPAPVYEKDLQSSSYRSYDDITNYETSQPIDRTYRTKHVHQPHHYHNTNSESETNNDKIRVSASTEIPKAEIMKQIEKSVIKYMQELEAEGKILTAPKDPRTHYKVVAVPVEEKRLPSTTTSRPKYVSSGTTSYHGTYNSATSSAPYAVEKATRYQIPKTSYKHHSHSEKATAYQAPIHSQQSDSSESSEPNVEIVYKIKSKAPLQTASVKTISKPYVLPQKTAVPDQFDHSSVLKNMEEFDLRHVVTAHDIEEQAPSTSRPSKLYFSSETHQDINSLPYKGDKSRLVATEYRKLKEPAHQSDYKGYSGYFAEPLPIQTDKEAYNPKENPNDGYPLLNPYQYVLKKEHLQTQYEEPSNSANWNQQRVHSRPTYSGPSGLKTVEYENYSSKYNNHSPENYEYVQTYKSERDREPATYGTHKHVTRHVLGKRGKRGNTHHANTSKKSTIRSAPKEAGTNFALRPPPKV